MGTVTVEIPDDIEGDLETFLEQHPQFRDAEDLFTTFLRGVLEMQEAKENVEHATDATQHDESEQAVEALKNAIEANERAKEALLDFFGVPRELSEETIEQIEESRRQFERGEYVRLEDI